MKRILLRVLSPEFLTLMLLTGATGVSVLFGYVVLVGCGGPYEVHATLEWEGPSGRTYTMGNVDVELTSEDGKDDQKTSTDANGEITVTFANNPGTVQVTASLNSYAWFRYYPSETSRSVMTVSTTVGPFTQPTNEVTVDFGEHAEAPLWNILQATRGAMETLTVPMMTVDVYASTQSVWDPRQKRLFLEPTDFSSADVINHEYGHALMQFAIGGQPDVLRCDPHTIGKAGSPSCAWVEGWSDFFALVASYYKNSNVPTAMYLGYEMEGYSSSITGTDGYEDEGRVAAALWDLFDAHDDSSNALPYGVPGLGDRNKGYQVTLKLMTEALKNQYGGNVRTFLLGSLIGTITDPVALAKAEEIMVFNYVLAPTSVSTAGDACLGSAGATEVSSLPADVLYPVGWVPYLLDWRRAVLDGGPFFRYYDPSEIDGVGVLAGSSPGSLYGTQLKSGQCELLTLYPKSAGHYSWVLSPGAGILYKWNSQLSLDNRNYTRHSDLNKGEPVICAGEFYLEQRPGSINLQELHIELNDSSGHYKPDGKQCFKYVLDEFHKLGINTANVQVYARN